MEPATILVLVLCVGVVALLVWFEINSRRNEAARKKMSSLARPEPGPLQKTAQSKVESETDKAKAA